MRPNEGRSIFATAPCLVLGLVIILGGAIEASAMSLFSRNNNNGGVPHRSLTTTNNNNSNSNNGQNGSSSINANPVVVNPEPSTIVLLASGLLGLGLWRLRRKP